MSNLNRHPVRRTAAGVLAGALALSGAVVAATPASAAAGFTLERIAGADRYETSALTAARFDQAAAVTNVIVASGENGRAADALGASFLAGVRGAPVLLTPQAGLAATTRAALTTLRANGATTVTIVGGPAAVSAAVQAQITALGFTVDRLGGVDRFQTAELVVAAGEVAAAGNTGVASNVGIVASGISTVDALAVGPLAYKGRHPIFLTRAAGLSAGTIASMRANGVTSVFIVGGETVVSANVRTQLTAAGITVVDRLAGQTRSGTSVAIANAIIGGTFGFTNTTFNVASGANDGVDALSGAALSGQQNRALLITDTATSAGAVTAFATARAATLTAPGIIFGGPAAVSVAVETAIETAGGAVTTNQAFPVTVVGGNNVFLGGDVASRTRTYTATVPSGTSVDILLFNAANVTVGANGSVTFADADGNNVADQGTITGAAISSVNGVPGGSNNAIVSNGTVTFTITGDTANPVNVVPVIFVDANNDNQLNLTAPATANNNAKAPSEQFSVGAATNFLPELAALGSPGTVTIQAVPAGGGLFTAGGRSFTFDANDVFQFQGVAITQAQFESILAAQGTVTVNFNPSAAGVSTFNVQSAPLAPVTVLAAQTRNLDAGAVINDVQVTYTRPTANTSGTTYTLQRSSDNGANFTNVTTATQAAGTGTGVFVFNDLNLANGTYVYRVVATGAVTGATQNSAQSNAVTIPGTLETVRPTAVSTRVVTNGGFATDVDAGDVFRIVLSEDVAISGTAALRFTDSNGDQYQLSAGSNATFALNSSEVTLTGSDAGTFGANRVLTVTVTGTPTPINGTQASALPATFPITINAAAGVLDLAGNAFDPALSAVAATATFSGVTTTAATAGTAGNSLSIQVVTGATGAGNESRALAVTQAGNVITVTLGTDAAGLTAGATRAAIAAAVEALPSVNATVTTAGANVTGPVAAVTFTGGAAAGNATINP